MRARPAQLDVHRPGAASAGTCSTARPCPAPSGTCTSPPAPSRTSGTGRAVSSSSASTSAPGGGHVPGGARRVGVVGVDVVGGDGQVAAGAGLVAEQPAEEVQPDHRRQQQRDQRGRRAAHAARGPAAPGRTRRATAGRSPARLPRLPIRLGICACSSITRASRSATAARTSPRRQMPRSPRQPARRTVRAGAGAGGLGARVPSRRCPSPSCTPAAIPSPHNLPCAPSAPRTTTLGDDGVRSRRPGTAVRARGRTTSRPAVPCTGATVRASVTKRAHSAAS